MEFERTESGLLIPKHAALHSPARRVTFFRKGLRAFTNALFVVIQLVTVWILWKTYQDTVIPNRQKELLAEQVAQLEMDRKSLVTRIDVAQKRVSLGIRILVWEDRTSPSCLIALVR